MVRLCRLAGTNAFLGRPRGVGQLFRGMQRQGWNQLINSFYLNSNASEEWRILTFTSATNRSYRRAGPSEPLKTLKNYVTPFSPLCGAYVALVFDQIARFGAGAAAVTSVCAKKTRSGRGAGRVRVVYARWRPRNYACLRTVAVRLARRTSDRRRCGGRQAAAQHVMGRGEVPCALDDRTERLGLMDLLSNRDQARPCHRYEACAPPGSSVVDGVGLS